MKKLITILFVLISFTALAQVKVVGYLTTNGATLYPTHLDSLGYSGYRVVYDTTQRNAITCLRRKFGMAVYTQIDTTLWILRDSACANVWVKFSSGTGSTTTAGYALLKTGDVIRADSATLAAYFLRIADSLQASRPLGYLTQTSGVTTGTAQTIPGAKTFTNNTVHSATTGNVLFSQATTGTAGVFNNTTGTSDILKVQLNSSDKFKVTGTGDSYFTDTVYTPRIHITGSLASTDSTDKGATTGWVKRRLAGGGTSPPVTTVAWGSITGLITEQTDLVDYVTTRIAPKLNISDTSAMLGNYFNSPGYGLLRSGHVVYADSSLLLTKLMAANLYNPFIVAPYTNNKYYNGHKQFVTLNTDSITEGSTNLFYTNARARGAISLTTTGTSGPASYSSSTGVLNVPQYGTLGGSGTVSYLPKWETSSTLNNSNIVQDAFGNILIGSATNPASNSRFLVYGGNNGSNVDVRGASGSFTDQALLELEGNNYDVAPNSLRMGYTGSTHTSSFGDFGLPNTKLASIVGSDVNNFVIGTQGSNKPVNFGTNNIIRARLTDSGFKYNYNMNGLMDNLSIPNKRYVDSLAVTGTDSLSYHNISLLSDSTGFVLIRPNLTKDTVIFNTPPPLSVAKVPLSYNSSTGVFDFDTTTHHSLNYLNTRYVDLFNNQDPIVGTKTWTGRQIYYFGDDALTIARTSNTFNRFNVTNTHAGSSAGGGLLSVNNINSTFQFTGTSSNNVYVPDAGLIYASGTGGMHSAFSGAGASYTIGTDNHRGTRDILKLDSIGTLRVHYYKNNAGEDSVLSTDVNGKFKMKYSTALASGIYTPTLNNFSNTTSSVAHPSQYMRVGNVVTVSGSVDITPTATGQFIVKISVPITTTFANYYEAGGTGAANGSVFVAAGINASNGESNVFFISRATVTTTHSFSYSFTYTILP